MLTGTIKNIVEHRGFGFLTPEGGKGEDVFFHVSALEGVELKELRAGDAVVYEAEEGDRGPRAKMVRRAEGE